MENEEIDLIEVMAKLWHRKRTIMYIALFFLVGGLVLAFFLPRKYTAQCTLGLEMEDRTTRISVEGMSPFQSMPMGDMRNTRIVSPAMYPDIFFSVPFQKELIYSPLYIDERGDTVTFYNYLVSGPERLALVADPSQVEQLTEEESKCLAYLKDAFSVKVNNKDGNLKITLDLPDPKLSAYLTNRAQAMLQTYIARFRIAKAQAALDFAEERYTEVKNELEKKQQALVQFREKHPDRTSVQLETEEKILTNDYELFFGLYSDIVKQREKAKIQVKEDMPVLTVIEPVVEPTVPSKPQRALIVLASLLLGLFVGCGFVLIQPIFSHRAAKNDFYDESSSGQGKIGLRLLHLLQGGVAIDGTVALHADSTEAVGKGQILGQAFAGKLCQLGGGHAVPLQLPQERADKAVPRAGGVHRRHLGAAGAGTGGAGVGADTLAAAGVQHQLHVAGKERGQCGFNILRAGEEG